MTGRSNRDVAQQARALGLGPRGRRFESCHPDQKRHSHYGGCLFVWHYLSERYDQRSMLWLAPAREKMSSLNIPIAKGGVEVIQDRVDEYVSLRC